MLIMNEELKKFNNTYGAYNGSTKKNISILKDNILTYKNINENYFDVIESSYESENKRTILSQIEKVNEQMTEVEKVVSQSIEPLLNESDNLLDKIAQLEDLKNKYDSLREIAYTYDEDKNITNKDIADSNNRTKESHKTNYYALEEEALRLLAKLREEEYVPKAKELSNISSNSKILESVLADPNMKKGELNKFTYKDPVTGVKLEGYVYIPVQLEEKPAVHVYLHGGGEGNGRVLNQSLPKLLKENLVGTSAIVICPQSNNGEWRNEKLEDTVVNYTKAIVAQYGADENKVSLSGHSAGAVGGYKIIGRYPDMFSAFVPISGHAEAATSKIAKPELNHALGNIKIWGFHGKKDSNIPIDKQKVILKSLKNDGYDNMELYTIDGGHAIQNDIYTHKYDYRGELVNPLEWAISQSL